MKSSQLLFFILIFSLSWQNVSAQYNFSDSAEKVLAATPDSLKPETLIKTGRAMQNKGVEDQALSYFLKSLEQAEANKDQKAIYSAQFEIADFYGDRHKFDLAMEYATRALSSAERLRDTTRLYNILNLTGGIIYFNHGDYDSSEAYGKRMMQIAENSGNAHQLNNAQMYMGDVYRAQEKFQEALGIYYQARMTLEKLNDPYNLANCYNNIAVIYDVINAHDSAIAFYTRALAIYQEKKEVVNIAQQSRNLARQYFYLEKYDKALVYAKSSQQFYIENKLTVQQAAGAALLGKIYGGLKNYKEAYEQMLLHSYIVDSLKNDERHNKLNSVQLNYEKEQKQKELAFEQQRTNLQKTIRNILIGASLLLIVTLLLIANRYRLKKKSELELSKKNNQLEQAMSDLKSMQAQVIQHEKMASLGELTAGIAHEIQNPLNFVNNFSEINSELIDELEQVLKSGDHKEAIAIAGDLKENEGKINYHGKRADSIVKGMLQHSRTSTGEKTPTDINALADEYLRLSYHGLRSKDILFNALLETDFDPHIGVINVISQDISRVLLNLFNNAFYAVSDRKKISGKDFFPKVKVTTKKDGEHVVITVKDNGTGIPQNILDKIFQPFFTTKPTGQGTGLGLSLSYDIVKSHGGDIKVRSKEGEGTEFVVILNVG